MKIIKPYAALLKPNSRTEGIEMLQHIEDAGRISHRSENNFSMDSWERFIQNVIMDHGDWSVVEHQSVSVDMIVDRGITHELVRHRLFSFTQESTRFVNYVKKMPPSFVYPEIGVECEFCLQGNETIRFPDGWFHNYGTLPVKQQKCLYNRIWLSHIFDCEEAYKKLLIEKWSPQIARSVLPNALASRIRVSGNLRNWRHFFLMRTTAETHPQMKQISVPLLQQFKEFIPLIYDDIAPGSRQIENLKKAR